MLHILTIPVTKIIHARIRNLKYSNIDVQQNSSQKRSKFEYYLTFTSFSFLDDKPLDFTCAAKAFFFFQLSKFKQ